MTDLEKKLLWRGFTRILIINAVAGILTGLLIGTMQTLAKQLPAD